MRKQIFATGQYYHVYNRGVDKRSVYENRKDYMRFMIDVIELNQEERVVNLGRRSLNEPPGASEAQAHQRCPLVSIICFCLMPNHFHFLLKQMIENGISRFMHKLGTAYTMYFNKRYGRKGSLFQGPFSAKWIETDAYLVHLSRYIHLNPLELWGESGKARKESFFWRYPWSSLGDYVSITNRWGYILDPSIVLEQVGGPSYYKSIMAETILPGALID